MYAVKLMISHKTHAVCYTYCRATTGVSYVTPIYYADRLCDRVRLYLSKTWVTGDAEWLKQLEDGKEDLLLTRQNARNNAVPDQDGNIKIDAKSDEAKDEETLPKYERAQVLRYAQHEFHGLAAPDVTPHTIEENSDGTDPTDTATASRSSMGSSSAATTSTDATPTASDPTGNPWHHNLSKVMFWM
jgi:hypothetical protein